MACLAGVLATTLHTGPPRKEPASSSCSLKGLARTDSPVSSSDIGPASGRWASVPSSPPERTQRNRPALSATAASAATDKDPVASRVTLNQIPSV